MKIDNAINIFVEKYDRKALESINEISKEFGLNVNRVPIRVFNINEAFDNFSKYIRGYAVYKVNNKNNEKASPHNAICESTNNLIDNELFKPIDSLYKDLPSFVESYINGIKQLQECINESMDMMMKAEIDDESIASLTEFTDSFMNSMDHQFDESMDRILWASGYKKGSMFKKKQEEKPVFL